MLGQTNPAEQGACGLRPSVPGHSIDKKILLTGLSARGYGDLNVVTGSRVGHPQGQPSEPRIALCIYPSALRILVCLPLRAQAERWGISQVAPWRRLARCRYCSFWQERCAELGLIVGPFTRNPISDTQAGGLADPFRAERAN